MCHEFQVYVDGELITTWTSSGTTDDFESIDLSGTSGELIEVTGILGESEWLSIVEVSYLWCLPCHDGAGRRARVVSEIL